MIKLIIEDDEGKTTIVPLIRDEITIGRKEGNTIRLTERNVSRRHAKLIKQDGKVYVEDLGSYNGIFVNGAKITGRVPVSEGDKIQIGDYVLALKFDIPQAAPKPDPFEEMKTIPLERTAQPEPETPPMPAPVPGAQPAQAQPAPQPAAAPSTEGAAPQPAQAAQQAPAAPAPAAQPQPAGKLVVVSEHLFGAEFSLDRPTMVIGRLPENDIVLEHKSISRHHAKVVRDGNHYTIIDLGSQNGVIVNGERYDKVQLRKGDMVDLGHIRLRYVAPGEDYHPVRSARELPAAKGKLGLLAAGGALVVAAVVIYFVAFHKSSGPSKKSKPTPKPRPLVAQVVDAGTPQAVESIDYSPVQSALQARDWAKAVQEARKILGSHPKDRTAKELLAQARREKKNQKRFEAFKAAWDAGQVAKAVDLGKDFPEQSIYHKDVQALWPQVVGEYVNQLVVKARKYVREGRCTEAKILARKALAFKPDETRFQPLVDRCGRAGGQVAVRTPGGHRTRTPPRPEDIRPTRPRPATGPDKAAQAKELLAQARRLWLTNQCSQAIRIARKAYRLRATSGAAMIIGTCSCNLHRRHDAQWAFRHMHSQAKKNLLVKVCRSKGINLQ